MRKKGLLSKKIFAFALSSVMLLQCAIVTMADDPLASAEMPISESTEGTVQAQTTDQTAEPQADETGQTAGIQPSEAPELSQEPEAAQQDPEAGAATLEQLAGDLKITVNAPEGAFPEGVTMTAIPKTAEDLPEEILKQLEAEGRELIDAVGADITFYTADSQEIEPAVPVEVRFEKSISSVDAVEASDIPEEAKAEAKESVEEEIYHVDDAGSASLVETADPQSAETVFEADQFSAYYSVTSAKYTVNRAAGTVSETIENGDFETGDFTGWTLLDGTALTDDNNNVGVVSDAETYWSDPARNIYKHGTYCLRGDPKESLSGAIRSSSFILGGDGYISFLIGAASAEGKGCVKLYQENGEAEATLIKTYINDKWKDPDTGLTLIRIYDQLESYIGKELYFVVENGSEVGFSFINVDDFRTSLTRAEVIALQDETLASIQEIEDPSKEYIISCYRQKEIIPSGTTISFDLNGGSGTCPAPIRSYDQKTVFLPDGTGMNRTDHILLGWAETPNTNNISDSDFTQKIYEPGSSYLVPDQDITLYAVWAQNSGELMDHITIALRNDGKAPAEPATYNDGQYKTLKEKEWVNILDYINPVRTVAGIDNVKPCLTERFQQFVSDSAESILNDKGMSYDPNTQYIEWYVIKFQTDDDGIWHVDGVIRNKAMVSLDYNPNCTDYTGLWPDGQQYPQNSNATVSKPVNEHAQDKPLKRPGYDFIGWNTKPDGTGVSYQPDETIHLGTENVTLYAQWEGINNVLAVTKTVEGNMGDKDQDFNFTLTLTKDGAAYTDELHYTKAGTSGTLTCVNDQYTFTLKHGQRISFTIPYGYEYRVEETLVEGYKTYIGTDMTNETSVATGTLNSSTTVAFTNRKDVNPPTGFPVNPIPYILMIIAALAVTVLFFFNCRNVRRRS